MHRHPQGVDTAIDSIEVEHCTDNETTDSCN